MLQRLSAIIVGMLVLAACGSASPAAAPSATLIASTEAPIATDAAVAPTAVATSAAPAASTGTPTSAASSNLRKVTLAMSYIPNVQFAPYYIAASKGYYAQAGFDVAFDYNFENDVVQRVAQGSADFAMASGLSVLLARQQELPVKMVATLYQQLPVVFFSKTSANITTVADMKGKTLGIPGRFGANYYGLLALLYANKLQESDITIQEIGFTQVQALQEDKVQITTGYAMNEPVLLRQQGTPVNVIRVADSFSLASDGIITSDTMLQSSPDMVRGFVQATLKGLQDALDDPDQAFTTSLTYIPELKDDATKKLQRQVLQETLPYWQSDKTKTQGLGYTDPEVLKSTHTFLRDSKLLQKDVDIEQAYTNTFLK